MALHCSLNLNHQHLSHSATVAPIPLYCHSSQLYITGRQRLWVLLQVVYGLDYLVSESASRLDALRAEVVSHLAASPEALLVVEEYDKLDCSARGLWRQLLQHPERANITSNRWGGLLAAAMVLVGDAAVGQSCMWGHEHQWHVHTTGMLHSARTLALPTVQNEPTVLCCIRVLLTLGRNGSTASRQPGMPTDWLSSLEA